MKLYKITYTLLLGDTPSYGHQLHTYAQSPEKAKANMIYRLGKTYKNARDITIEEVQKIKSNQLSMFGTI